MELFSLPGLAGAIVDGDEVQYINIGNAKPSVPVSEKTCFEIGSISKAVLHMTLAQQVERYPSDYFDKLIGSNITTHHLVTHGSGLAPLSGTMQAFLGFSEKSIIHSIPSHQYIAEAGEKFQYNNCAYWKVAELVEQKTNKPWQQVVFKNVLHPLGMSNSVYGKPDDNKLARPYISDNDKNCFLENPSFSEGLLPAAGLWSTTEDLTSFAQFILNVNNPLSSNANDIFCEFQPVYNLPKTNTQSMLDEAYITKGYGLGHFVVTPAFSDKDRIINFVGGTPGYSALVSCMPEYKKAIVMLTNKMSQSELLEYIACKSFEHLVQDNLTADLYQFKQEKVHFKEKLRSQLTHNFAHKLPEFIRNKSLQAYNSKYGDIALLSDDRQIQLIFANGNKILLFGYDINTKEIVSKNVDSYISEVFPKINLYITNNSISWCIWMANHRGDLIVYEQCQLFGSNHDPSSFTILTP